MKKEFFRLLRFLLQRSSLFSKLFLRVWKLLKRKNYDFIEVQTKSWIADISDKKRAKRVHFEMIRDFWIYGALPEDYAFYNFEYLNPRGKEQYVTDRLRYKLLYQVNDRKDDYTFINKYKAYITFQPFYMRDAVLVRDENDRELFEFFFKQHGEVVIKRAEFSRGRDVQLLSSDKIDVKAEFSKLMENNDGHGYILEEKIVQREEMAKLNPSSVNTIRIPTCITENGVEIFHPVVRMGRAGSFVDNGSQGGIFAAIDIKTGIVSSSGKDKGCFKYTVHPDSGVQIVGFQIPMWKELVEVVKKAARIVPSTKYVGWDMAFTDRGWVVVEGNNYGQFFLLQMPAEQGFRYEFEDLMKIKT